MPKWYDNKKEYSANWTKENTKMIGIRFSKDDEVWDMIKTLKSKGYKMNTIFKEAIINEYKKDAN